jgi:hypothetical protein
LMRRSNLLKASSPATLRRENCWLRTAGEARPRGSNEHAGAVAAAPTKTGASRADPDGDVLLAIDGKPSSREAKRLLNLSLSRVTQVAS